MLKRIKVLGMAAVLMAASVGSTLSQEFPDFWKRTCSFDGVDLDRCRVSPLIPFPADEPGIEFFKGYGWQWGQSDIWHIFDKELVQFDTNGKVIRRYPYKVFLETDRHVFFIEILTGSTGKRWANFSVLYQYDFLGNGESKSFRALYCGDPPVALFDRPVAEIRGYFLRSECNPRPVPATGNYRWDEWNEAPLYILEDRPKKPSAS